MNTRWAELFKLILALTILLLGASLLRLVFRILRRENVAMVQRCDVQAVEGLDQVGAVLGAYILE